MSFDVTEFKQMLADYLDDCVEIRIMDYIGDTNPIGGPSQGVNIDVGETHSFDIEAKNNGSLGLMNVHVEIEARRGKVSNSWYGLINTAGSHWMAPWHTSMAVRAFNLDPGQSYLHKHETSGGHLFGYNAEEPTGGSDNNRDVEILLTAKIVAWQPDLSKFGFDTKNGPQDTWETFIQRT